MGIIESGVGYYIGTKIIVSKNQQRIVQNIYDYQNNKIDVGYAKKMMAIGILTAISPYLLLGCFILLSKYIPSPDELGSGFAALCILLFFAWMFTSILIVQNINKKYGFYVYLQNPQKEKMYRWQYLVLFEDEIAEWKEYIKTHVNMRPSGIVEPIVIDRNTNKILGNLQI